MSKKVLGTCSICGGAVTIPSVFYSVVPPTPTCESCGAVRKDRNGPIIEMEPGPIYKPGVKTIQKYSKK